MFANLHLTPHSRHRSFGFSVNLSSCYFPLSYMPDGAAVVEGATRPNRRSHGAPVPHGRGIHSRQPPACGARVCLWSNSVAISSTGNRWQVTQQEQPSVRKLTPTLSCWSIITAVGIRCRFFFSAYFRWSFISRRDDRRIWSVVPIGINHSGEGWANRETNPVLREARKFSD